MIVKMIQLSIYTYKRMTGNLEAVRMEDKVPLFQLCVASTSFLHGF